MTTGDHPPPGTPGQYAAGGIVQGKPDPIIALGVQTDLLNGCPILTEDGSVVRVNTEWLRKLNEGTL